MTVFDTFVTGEFVCYLIVLGCLSGLFVWLWCFVLICVCEYLLLVITLILCLILIWIVVY